MLATKYFSGDFYYVHRKKQTRSIGITMAKYLQSSFMKSSCANSISFSISTSSQVG